MEQCFLDNKHVWPSKVSDLARLHHCSGLDTYVTASLELELQCQLHARILLAGTVRELGVAVCLEQLGCTNEETLCDCNWSLPLLNTNPGQTASTCKTVGLNSQSSQHTDTANETTAMQCHVINPSRESVDSEGNPSCLTSNLDDTPTENWDAELIETPHLDTLPIMQQFHQRTEADNYHDTESWDDSVMTTWENIVETKMDSGVDMPRLNNKGDTRPDFTWEASNPKKLFVNNISYRSRVKEVWEFFEKFGPVEHFQLLRDKNNRPKGTGFVTFKSMETVIKVLGLSEEDLTLRYRVLYVQPAGFWKAQGPEGDTVEENQTQSQTETEVEEEQEDNGLMHIHDLNDDVMMRIFGCLHLRKRLQSERVCKRWRNISHIYWRTVEHLKFDSFFVGFGVLTDRGLCNLLKRGSQALKSLDLSLASRQLSDGALAAIGRHCPNLVRLNAAGMSATNRGIKQFTETRPQIQWISLRDCHNIGEDGLWWLFHRCKELKYIDLTANKRFVGKCLHMLSSNVETLILNCCAKLQDRGVDKIALRCPALKELQLNDCKTLTDHCLSVLSQHCHLLAVVHLCGMFKKITSSGLRELGSLESLEELYLSNNLAVDDNVLAALGRGCKKLRILDLTSCHRSVTDAGLVSLSLCPMLQDLSLSYLHKVCFFVLNLRIFCLSQGCLIQISLVTDTQLKAEDGIDKEIGGCQITDEGLKAIVHSSRLTRLIVRCCGGLTDSVLQLLSVTCFDLCTLDLSGNQQVTNVTLHALLESAATAPERRLSLHIGGTSIVSDNVVVPDNVILHLRDISVHHFRQDRDLIINLGFYDSDDEEEADNDYLDDSDFRNEDHGAAPERVMWAPSEEMAALFLECDDPLAEEEWAVS